MGSTNLRAHHVARPGRAESERSQAGEACTFPLLRVTYLRNWWGVGGVGRNSSSGGKNRSPNRWGAGWGVGWGAASKTRIGRLRSPGSTICFELRRQAIRCHLRLPFIWAWKQRGPPRLTFCSSQVVPHYRAGDRRCNDKTPASNRLRDLEPTTFTCSSSQSR